MKNVIFFAIAIFFTGCSPQLVQVKQPPELTFNRSPSYEVDLSGIQKPEPLKREYGKLNPDGVTIDLLPSTMSSEADVIILNKEEYKKIAELVNLAASYKAIVLNQEVLINEKIKVENSLKEFVELERLKTREYADMWTTSENNYRIEAHDRRMDNIVSKTIQILLTGGIIILAF